MARHTRLSVIPRYTRRAFLAALPAAAFGQVAAPHADRVDPSVEYQTIENFGASDCWRTERLIGWSEGARNRVADLLFSREKGIGLSCWRYNIGAGTNPHITQPWRSIETFEVAPGRYDWTRQPGQRWFLRAAKARGVPQFLAFSLSGTGRMTRNGLTFDTKGLGTTNLQPGKEAEYARYLADILQHFSEATDEAERVTFDYISPVNEPQWDWIDGSQEGDRASNADIKRLLDALSSELRARSLRSEIIAPESGSLPDMWSFNKKTSETYRAAYGNYLQEFAGDSTMADLLRKRLSYHSYWSDRIGTQLVEHRRQLRDNLVKHPGWRLWQTEYCVMDGPEGNGGPGRDLTMKTALDVARVIHLDLTLVGVSAWQWWTAVSEADYKDGLIYTDWKKPGDPETIHASRLLWTLGNFSRFIRPGMVRVALDGPGHDIRGLMGSAYKNRRRGELVVVYLNAGAVEQTVNLSLANTSKPGPLIPYITSDREGDELKRYPVLEPGEPIRIPRRSAVTLVARSMSDPGPSMLLR